MHTRARQMTHKQGVGVEWQTRNGRVFINDDSVRRRRRRRTAHPLELSACRTDKMKHAISTNVWYCPTNYKLTNVSRVTARLSYHRNLREI